MFASTFLFLILLRPYALAGDWRAVELQTSKGKADTSRLEWGLYVEGNRFRFVGPDGQGTGKLVRGKAGLVELVGAKGTLYGSWTIEGDRLTLALWGREADRLPTPSTDNGGIVFVFMRARPGKAVDA
jgi:hypothetical protein